MTFPSKVILNVVVTSPHHIQLTKICTKCGVSKPLVNFQINSRYKDGYINHCKDCMREYSRTWYKKNKQSKLEVGRKWRQANREYLLQKQQSYYEANKERELNRTRKWYQQNKERVAERTRKYREANKESIDERNRKWRKANPEKQAVTRHKRRALLENCEGTYTAQEFIDLCKLYGNVCLSCGIAGKKLTVDHVVPISKGGSNGIENIQPLCGSCNSSKGVKIIDYRERTQELVTVNSSS